MVQISLFIMVMSYFRAILQLPWVGTRTGRGGFTDEQLLDDELKLVEEDDIEVKAEPDEQEEEVDEENCDAIVSPGLDKMILRSLGRVVWWMITDWEAI